MTRTRSKAVSASASAFEDGRDSIQLAEFPLAILSDCAPPDLKTIEFEDEIKDWSTGKNLRRRVVITGSDKFGLPTPKDEEILIGLMQLTKRANNFSSPELRFTKRELIDLLNWPKSSWAFNRVSESLHRWKGVSIHFFNAWRDHTNKTWQNSVALGVIEYTEIESYTTDKRSKEARERGQSCIIWNKRLFDQFREGYLKKLDFAVYRSLKRPAAKRAYRFLDKRFYHAAQWEFDLKTFACEKLGLSRSYDTGQLKERLQPALQELHDVGFIEPVKYRKQRPKHWTIEVTKKESVAEAKLRMESDSSLDGLVAELVQREVAIETARLLVKSYDEPHIRAKIVFFDSLMKKNDKRVERNPPGFLVSAIKRDFKPPRSTVSSAIKKQAKKPGCIQQTPSSRMSKAESDSLAVLEQLSPEDFETLVQTALRSATRLQQSTYERLSTSKNRLFEEFRMQLAMKQWQSMIHQPKPHAADS